MESSDLSMAKRLTIAILFLAIQFSARSQEQISFQAVDERTLDLYESAKWKELNAFGKKALRQGADYYYLRMRLGIANYELERYLIASRHFDKALKFNDFDPLPKVYLVNSYLNTNKEELAREVFTSLPEAARQKMDTLFTGNRGYFYSETGPVFTAAGKALDKTRFNDTLNLYAEADIPKDGYYFTAGMGIDFKHKVKVFTGYSIYAGEGEFLARTSDSVLKDQSYSIRQNQFYVNSRIYLSKGYSLTPAFHYITLKSKSFTTSFDTTDLNYTLQENDISTGNYIGFLLAEKDLGMMKMGLFFALSDLGNVKQFQIGANYLIYPLGNLNLFISTTLLDHVNDGRHNMILEENIGGKVAGKLWAELYFTVGKMENYYNKNAYVLYNVNDKITFLGGNRWTLYINNNVSLSLDYKILLREDEYLFYRNKEQGNSRVTESKTEKYEYQSLIILGGIIWKI